MVVRSTAAARHVELYITPKTAKIDCRLVGFNRYSGDCHDEGRQKRVPPSPMTISRAGNRNDKGKTSPYQLK